MQQWRNDRQRLAPRLDFACSQSSVSRARPKRRSCPLTIAARRKANASAQRPNGMPDPHPRTPQQIVQAGERTEDTGMFQFIGLVGVALISRLLAEIAGYPGAVDPGEDEREPRERILEIEMQDVF